MGSIQLTNELEFYSDPYDYVRGATASTERPTDDYRVHDWATDNHTAIRAHYIPASGIYPATPSIKCEVHYLRNA